MVYNFQRRSKGCAFVILAQRVAEKPRFLSQFGVSLYSPESYNPLFDVLMSIKCFLPSRISSARVLYGSLKVAGVAAEGIEAKKAGL